MRSSPDTSASPAGTGGRWAASWATAPRIVAESLRTVADPLRTGLTAGPPASGAEVARSLARSLAPAEHPSCPPGWLLPGQARSFRRAMAALERYHGALLADPVGSGKTYVALAVASLLQGRHPTPCLVPAALAAQWRAVAERVGVPVEVGTHQLASRGRLPGAATGLVIIDECHHFRNPLTRRYAHVAPWLVGRRVLLLSATPVVNRLEDLAHQLLLGVRDDALIADGMVSLRASLAAGRGLSALGPLVIEDTAPAGPRPARLVGVSVATAGEADLAEVAIANIGRLRLSRHPPIAALLRGVLHRAASSSPAALVGAVRRYRALLLHARDARHAGRALGRAELRDFAGELDDQVVLWALIAGDSRGEAEIALDDLATIDDVVADAARAVTRDDPKLERLRDLLADRRPTLVFSTRRETVRHLRDRLAPPPVAWCTGERAGLGLLPAPRASVLGWFRDELAWEAPGLAPPHCLVVTDVAAEGLDLRRAARVVHYDLPWTPMRLEQREGRAVRLGSARELVDVVRFIPPPALDATLELRERLHRKAELPGRAGLGADGMRLWRWRSALVDQLRDGPVASGTASASGSAWVPGAATGASGRDGGKGILAGFELVALRRGEREHIGSVVGWLGPDGTWTEEESVVAGRLRVAATCNHGAPPTPDVIGRALDRLVEPVRARLALAAARRWTGADPDTAARRLALRLGELVHAAARRRDGGALARLERALAFAAGGHTAGEAMLVRRLADAPALAASLAGIPAASARWDAIDVRLTGLVIFED